MLHSGGFAGYQMINWATLAGARRLVLTGFDCQPTGGQVRWRGVHPAGVEQCESGDKFAAWVARLESVAADCREMGVAVVNCTRETALPWFERRSVEEVLIADRD